MKTLTLIGLSVIAGAMATLAEPPKTENKDWEKACGGSNIAVTSVAGKIIAIEAFVEHSTEARQWQCHFKDGKIVSAVYRHFIVTRQATADAAAFRTELHADRAEAFHFPDHDLSHLAPELKRDLTKVMAIAMGQGS
jgi:hypothetical protein